MNAKSNRVIGLDFGAQTVGVAVSDETRTITTPLETIRRKDEFALKQTIEKICQIVHSYGVGEIALGYPKNMNNTEGPRCERTLDFKKKLEKRLPDVKIHLVDERLTTKLAERFMREVDTPRKQREKNVDGLAASLILDEFILRNTKKV